MNVNSWWRNLNSRFKQYSTRVDELSKNAEKVKEGKKTGEILTNIKELKGCFQKDLLPNLRGQLFKYCNNEVEFNLPKFFSQQKEQPNISNDLIYPMKNELNDALLKLLKKNIKLPEEELSEIKLSDWLNSTVSIWKTKSKSYQDATGPWKAIIDNVINKISQHNGTNKILEEYMEKNSSACNKSLIESSQEYNFKYTELREEERECFQTLTENEAKKTTLHYLQQLVSMKIDKDDLDNYASALNNSPDYYSEYVYVWCYLQYLTNEIKNEIKIGPKNLITNYIPSPTNLQQNENVDLSNCVERCLTYARECLTSQSNDFVVLWEKKHSDDANKKMWKEIYAECRDRCVKSYRLPSSKDPEKIYNDLKTYVRVTMQYALCKLTGVKDKDMLERLLKLKKSYDGRKGLPLKAMLQPKTNAANKIRKHYLSHKKKWELKPDIYEALQTLLKTLNMSIDDNSFPKTLPKTLKNELKTAANSDGAKKVKVRHWLISKRKKLEEEIKNKINVIELALNEATQTLNKCKNVLESLAEETNKRAKKKINVSEFLIWP